MIKKDETNERQHCKCNRCGYEWYGKDPKFCANCNSPYWNKPRQNEVNKESEQ